MKCPAPKSLAAVLLCLHAGSPQAADPDWSLCGDVRQAPTRPTIESDGADATQIDADQAEVNRDAGTTLLSGNVQVQQGQRVLQAESVVYDDKAEVLDVTTGLRYWDESLYTSGGAAHMELDSREGWITDTSYRLIDRHGRGQADRITLGSEDIVLLEKTTYTTCNPGVQDWLFSADSITLNKQSDVGTARNLKVRFKGVPVYYSPIMTFPLSDRRKTGFLTPSIGGSSEVGIEATLPFYWNIAPQRDATFGLRGMSKRGLQLQSEYRYLTTDGSGQLGLEFLPNDQEFDASRGLVNVRHRQNFARGWSLNVDFSHASDKRYFEDLGTNLAVTSTSFLDRRLDLSFQNSAWSVLGRLQGYQTINRDVIATDRPYSRLPQILLSSRRPERNKTFNPQLNAELVHFDRSNGVTGTRIDLHPSLSYPLRNAGGFLVPKLSLRHTRYALDDTTVGQPDDPTRTVPGASLDGGLFFDRDVRIGGRPLLQTLEPRAYLLYVAERDQSKLPVFDSSEFSFNFAQLFRENRFSGADRVGDARQITLALTTRLLNPANGNERLRASIGQIHYFDDRSVTLPGATVQRDNASDLVGEIAATIARDWQLRAGLQWDASNERTEKSTVWVRYRPGDDRVLNMGYRFVRDAVEQADVSFRWPMSHTWNAVGRWNYALADKRTLETFGGIEYESCCWALRFVLRRHLNSADGDSSNGIFLQLELKGLGGLGNNPQGLLRRSIPGYDDEF